MTFDKILARDFKFPESPAISDEARDLIDKLLQLQPLKRLGAGKPGTENDINSLKNHPYFSGIDWETLHKQPVPEYDIPEVIQADSRIEIQRSQTL